MKKIIQISLLLFGAIAFSSFAYIYNSNSEGAEMVAGKNVKWYTWDEAVAANKIEKRKFFVDIYTDWCGWCKKMDAQTFEQAEVAAYLNKHFYPIKLDAEQKADIVYNGNTFKWVNSGRRGIHELAYSLLDGSMSYPSLVFLTEKEERIMISKGFKKKNEFMKELKFVEEEHFKTTSLNNFKAKGANP
jgi:uncharacterized protein YyaL (SSP411 family)